MGSGKQRLQACGMQGPTWPEPQWGASGWCPGEVGKWMLTGSGPDQPLCSSLLSLGVSPLGSQSATPEPWFLHVENRHSNFCLPELLGGLQTVAF